MIFGGLWRGTGRTWCGRYQTVWHVFNYIVFPVIQAWRLECWAVSPLVCKTANLNVERVLTFSHFSWPADRA